jgi:hypothetical protein
VQAEKWPLIKKNTLENIISLMGTK